MQEAVTFPAGAQLRVKQPTSCITWAQTSQEPAIVKHADKSHQKVRQEKVKLQAEIRLLRQGWIAVQDRKHWCEQLWSPIEKTPELKNDNLLILMTSSLKELDRLWQFLAWQLHDNKDIKGGEQIKAHLLVIR